MLTTALYFVVFGAAIGGRIREVSGVSYGSFIVPGLMMLSLLTQSISNASIGIYFPKFTGKIFELLSAPCPRSRPSSPMSARRRPNLSRLGLSFSRPRRCWCRCASTTRLDDCLPGADRDRLQPVWFHHRRLGEKLRAVGGHPFARGDAAHFPRRRLLSIDMLPPFWRAVSLFNPVVYLVSGFRWSFYGQGDVSVAASLGFTTLFIAACVALLSLIFRTGWRLKP